LNFLRKKIDRFFESRNVFRIRYLLNKIFGEKDLGNLGLDFSDKPTRQTIVQEIINLKNYQSYLEIGCYKNDLFDKVKCNIKVGVDPISGGTVRKTSDDYYKTNKEKFDIIFIDGLHHYEQVIKDINNSLNVLNENGVILLHDCLPNNVYEQVVPRCKHIWNGDVWKAIVECRTKENIDTYTCYADHGIGVIFKKNNKNILELEIKDFSKLKFKDYFYNYKKYMNLIEYSELRNLIFD